MSGQHELFAAKLDERGFARLGLAHDFLLHGQTLIVEQTTFGRRKVIRALDGVVAGEEKANRSVNNQLPLLPDARFFSSANFIDSTLIRITPSAPQASKLFP